MFVYTIFHLWSVAFNSFVNYILCMFSLLFLYCLFAMSQLLNTYKEVLKNEVIIIILITSTSSTNGSGGTGSSSCNILVKPHFKPDFVFSAHIQNNHFLVEMGSNEAGCCLRNMIFM